MTAKPTSARDRVTDPASVQMLDKALAEGIDTCFSRTDAQKARCGFGMKGLCCRICHMGPCRITPKNPRGICGADVDTIAARNFLRQVCGGAAAHSDHGRHLVLLLRKVAAGEGGDYTIRDIEALHRAALAYGINVHEHDTASLAGALARALLGEFTAQERSPATLRLAPARQQRRWEKQRVMPGGIDRTVVESMHRTHMGVDHDYRSLLMRAFATSLADGWGGSRIATMVSDILFGTPAPVRSRANLGVLRADTVNIVVHGHEPELSEMLAVASRSPALIEKAKQAGAAGITLAGICCTANEILMRHGIPIAGNFLQQELAVVTGAVELMLIDVQCCMPSLPEVAASYHTEIVSTSAIARTAGATHLPFDESSAMKSAETLIARAIDNFSRRDPARVTIPEATRPLVAGFSVPSIKYMLGGTYRASFRPLNDAIMDGRIRGVAGIVGCNNPQSRLDDYINEVTRELIGNNVLVLKTGCAAIASAKQGRLTPETALEEAGEGLREVCETVGMPPVLHMGSCVDNSRLLEAATEIVIEGGLGDDIAGLPAVGLAPEWMSEKAIAIGCYFVASGVDVILGHPFHIEGSEHVTRFLNEEVHERFGASFHVCETAQAAAARSLELINAAREKLGIDRRAERKLFDMKDRRELIV